jgi:NAD(P)-dependent dehydrogenase (short-subunit alcohol dehydrogenase family)
MHLEEMFKLDGKVAVITGGARHLGYDMAEILAEAGCDLVITSRTLSSAEQSAKRLAKESGRDVLPLGLDVTQPKEIESFADEAWRWKDRVDILINNAGGGFGESGGHLFQRSAEDIVTLISTNLIGSLLCCKALAPKMAEQGHGKIINVASIAGFVGRDRRMYDRNSMSSQPIDYAAAKAGVIGMTLDLAGLLSPMGILVNAISPGGFHGPTRTGPPESFVKDYSDSTPMGRMGRDGIDLKGAALYLASPASDYVTGHNLVVDGGFTIWH